MVVVVVVAAVAFNVVVVVADDMVWSVVAKEAVAADGIEMKRELLGNPIDWPLHLAGIGTSCSFPGPFCHKE